MIKIECPFFCLFGDEIKCPYLENSTYCYDVEIAPGNGDAWCSGKIEEALIALETNESFNLPGKLMRQNYSCNICGLKSFVIYESKEDEFDIVIRIREDHESKEPICPNPLGKSNIVGEPTEE